MLVEKVLLLWGDLLLLSWTRTLNIGMLAFLNCELHKFLALKLSQFHKWIFNGWMDVFFYEYGQMMMDEKLNFDGNVIVVTGWPLLMILM